MTTTAPTSSAATPTVGTPSATLQGLGSLADNFITFLTLLTTQLKNQDPTAPLDSNQFTQQLVQMTGVEPLYLVAWATGRQPFLCLPLCSSNPGNALGDAQACCSRWSTTPPMASPPP